ncbi:hypothetical protein [Rhizobium sp. SYY.PMSO]|uniref:hypothetical protein n=1 Tax=Rhizobium sp. SYY.PMSO TaxID=3382192 RepID=UPI0039900A2E
MKGAAHYDFCRTILDSGVILTSDRPSPIIGARENNLGSTLNSQVRLIQHPEDEREFANAVLAEDAVRLINGPRWSTEEPQTFRSISAIAGNYCIIWSPQDRAKLSARYIPAQNDWYCDAEMVTIQFLRSQLIASTIIEGRIAISTTHAEAAEAKGVERRFKALSRFIKKRYLNSVLCWYSPDNPIGPATSERTANPSAPDSHVWVGPHALHWLNQNRNRHVKQFMTSTVHAQLVDIAQLAERMSQKS